MKACHGGERLFFPPSTTSFLIPQQNCIVRLVFAALQYEGHGATEMVHFDHLSILQTKRILGDL